MSSSAVSASPFPSQSRTASSRTADVDIFLKCAARSRSDLSSADTRQLYTSVFMHYIVAHALLPTFLELPPPGHQSHLSMASPNHIHSLHRELPFNVPIHLKIHRPARRTSEQLTLRNRAQILPSNRPRVHQKTRPIINSAPFQPHTQRLYPSHSL